MKIEASTSEIAAFVDAWVQDYKIEIDEYTIKGLKLRLQCPEVFMTPYGAVAPEKTS